jgi:UDP-N-acetylmuramate dehydrogenase
LNLKGYRIGDAMVSLQHANFLINNGKASFEDMNELIKVIKDKVFRAYKVELELEVRFVSEK